MLLACVKRLEAVVEEETEALEARLPVDLSDLNRRKSQGLLELTRLGWTVSPMTQVLEVPATRARVRRELTHGAHPQSVLRIGHPGTRPAPPLRDRADVVRRGNSAPAHILNLGHGVPPSADPAVLTGLVDFAHSLPDGGRVADGGRVE